MIQANPTVNWEELQRRKLQVMAETVEHFKEVGGMKILIQPNVYPPGTDTHLLANTVQVKAGDEALDLCTGTGVVARKMAAVGAKRVLGTDLNPRAVDNAEKNKKLLGLDNLAFKLCDMFEGINARYDIITINPPYTDRQASDDIDICFYDKDHTFLKSFFSGLRAHLKPRGLAYIAWSNIGPMNLLPKLANEYGFRIQLLAEDVGGRGYTFYVYKVSTKDIV